MSLAPDPRSCAAFAGLFAAAFAGLGGCAGPGAIGQDRARAEAAYAEQYPVRRADRRIVIDGRMDEWPHEVVALADAEFIYARFTVEGHHGTLQASSDTLSLLLDVDGSTLTGRVGDNPALASGLGVDLEIQFSPMGPSGTQQGVAVFAVARDGTRTPMSHADADFSFAPTYASDWYELRVGRHIAGLDLLLPGVAPVPTDQPDGMGDGEPGDAEPAAGNIEIARTIEPSSAIGGGIFLLHDPTGELVGWSDPFTVELPPLSAQATRADIIIPRKRGDIIRIASWNVLHSSPEQNPEPFARVIRALDPDILLVQEWDDADDQHLTDWFNTHVGGTWTAVSKPQSGVAIVTQHRVIVSNRDDLAAAGSDRPVRFVSALIQTPLRDTAIGSVHLKCCGDAGGPEDVRRMNEAQAINTAFGHIVPTWPALRVIGGDLNLVGSREPLDVLRTGLDGDGSDLTIAEPIVLGDAAIYSWSDAASQFSPGRLDYLVFGDARARVVNAFILDVSRLSDGALGRMGLQRGDTSVSDHKPIVLDLKPF